VFYTYAHYTPEGRLFYIGKGNEDRAYKSSGRSLYWKRIVNKYGKPNIQILANWDTEQEALDHEVLLIECFKDLGHKLCNITSGGDGVSGLKQSEHQKAVASQVHKGNKWRQGIPSSAHQKAVASQVHKGNKYTVGRIQPYEQRQKNSIAQLGNKRAFGNKLSEETKQKISAKLLGRKINYRHFIWVGTNIITGEVKSFVGTNALKNAGFQHNNIIKCINGQRKSHKGYTWTKEKWEDKKCH
jgi:hypothetical protein